MTTSINRPWSKLSDAAHKGREHNDPAGGAGSLCLNMPQRQMWMTGRGSRYDQRGVLALSELGSR
jgi:hypothetical protein